MKIESVEEIQCKQIITNEKPEGSGTYLRIIKDNNITYYHLIDRNGGTWMKVNESYRDWLEEAFQNYGKRYPKIRRY